MKAIYPGTFDPITIGHLDIVERASAMMNEVVVLISHNNRKKCTFSLEERRKMIEDCIKARGLTNVHVEVNYGLTVQYAKDHGAGVIIRGIRAVSDYEFELQQATANMKLDEHVETVILIAKPEYSFLSSSVVREIAEHQGCIHGMVDEVIENQILNKYK